MGTQTLTYTYTDANSCTNSAQTTITVNPLPEVSAGTYGPVCVDAPDITLAGSPEGGVWSGTGVNGNLFDPSVGTQTLTYTYTDANSCANSAQTTITVNPLPEVSAGTYGPVCVDAPDITLAGSPEGGVWSGTGVNGNLFDPSVGTQTLTYTYTDANSCTNSAQTTITVNPLPEVSAGTYGPVCVDAPDITLAGSPEGGVWSGTGVNGNLFDPSVGTQTLTYTFTDANSCANSAQTTITVNPLPEVSAGTYGPVCVDAPDITLAGSPEGGVWSGTGVNGNLFDPSVGTQTLTYTFTDANSCANSAQTTITVNPLPELQVTVNGVQVTDNHDGTDDTGTFSVANSAGNNLSFTQVADLNSVTPAASVKVIQEFIRTNVTFAPADGVYPISAYSGAFSRSVSLVDLAQPGTLVMKLRTFFDANNNNILDNNECAGDWIVYTVKVNDADPPTAVCKDFTVELDASGHASINASDIDGGSTDNAGPVTLSASMTSFDCSNIGDNPVTLTVTDQAGNSSTCDATVTVKDVTPPVAQCKNFTAVLNDQGTATISAADINDGSYDGCGGIVTLAAGTTTFDCSNIGDNTVTLTVTDASGNPSSCYATVTVKDVTPPVAKCKNITISLNAQGTAAITADDINNGSYDGCGGAVTLSASKTSFNCANVGDNTVTLTVTDAGGNQASCSATVKVEDLIPPVINNMPANQILELGAYSCTVLAYWTAPAATDNCELSSLVSNDPTFDHTGSTQLSAGVHTITYTATDVNGNSSQASFTITVLDDIHPVIMNCPGDITVSADPGLCDKLVSWNPPTASDNCVGVGLSTNHLPGERFSVGSTLVTYTATDAAGNQTTCSFNVNVVDNQAPVISNCLNNIQVFTDGSPTCDRMVSFTPPSATDNCGGVTTTVKVNNAQVETMPSKFGVGTTPVEYIFTDTHGNSSTCSFSVIVMDNDPPTIICPADITVCEGEPINLGTPETSDNCGIQSVTNNAPASFPIGTTTVTWTVTDIHGNPNSCTQRVTVNALPIAVIEPPVTTELTCSLTSISLTATGGSAYSWSDGTNVVGTSATLIVSEPATYTVTVTSANGCADTESIVITRDNSAPVAGINTPATTMLTCSVTSIRLTASGDGTYSWSDGTDVVGTDATLVVTAPGTYTVTVTGANGCTDTESIIITQDIEKPAVAITNNSNTTVLTCSQQSISVTATGGVSYAWDNGLGNNAAATITAPGTYTVTATGANGCTNTAGIVITQDIEKPAVAITNNSNTTVLTCSQQSISVTATGGVSYAWDNGLGNNAAATITAPGTYTVTATGANGCTNTAGIVITQDIEKPAVAITNNSNTTVLTCSQQSISVTATGGVSYAWDNGLGNNAAATITAPGTYTVTATGANGCTNTAGITITQNTVVPQVAITNNSNTTVLTCSQQSISVTATGGVSYAWDNGLGNNAAATITAPGTYTVTATGANGCTNTAGITITQNTVVPQVAITNNSNTTVLTCSQQSISVTATGGVSYAWDNGLGNNAAATITAPGTYTVTATGANGCTNTAGITITQNADVPVVTLPAVGPLNLNSAPVQLAGQPAGGTYSGPGVSQSGLFTPSTLGNHLITYTYIGANGCSGNASITINVISTSTPRMQITLNGVTITSNNDGIDDTGALAVCNSATGNLTFTEMADLNDIAPAGLVKITEQFTRTNVTFTADDQTFPLVWLPSVFTEKVALINPAMPGTLVMKSRAFLDSNDNNILDANEAADDWIVCTVTVNPIPSASISYPGSPFCISVPGTIGVNLTGTAGGTFSAPEGLTIDAATGAITPETSSGGTYTVTYTVAAAGGCSVFSTTTQVTLTEAPSATISYEGSPFSTTVTQPVPVNRVGTGGGTYSASPAGLTINPSTGAITPSTSAPGTYTVTYTIAASGECSGFTTTTSVTVISSAIPRMRITINGVTVTSNNDGIDDAGALAVCNSATGNLTFTEMADLNDIAPAGLVKITEQFTRTNVTFTADDQTFPLVWLPPVFTEKVALVNPAMPGTLVMKSRAFFDSNDNNILDANEAADDWIVYTVTVNPIPSASISYPGSPFSTTITQPVPVNRVGTDGGTYSASPAGLTINPSTGAITPSTSTPGTYTITYTVEASGGCSTFTTTTSVTITAPTGTRTTTLTYSGATSAQYGSTVTLSARLRWGSSNVSGRTITFTISNQSASATTNSTGVASVTMTITQAPGSYRVISAFAGDALYRSSSDNDAFTITRRTVTAGLTGTVTKVYDGNATATLTPDNYTLTGVINGDDVTLNNPATGTYNNRSVGTNKPVTVTGLALLGTDADKYTLSSTTISANIGTITARLRSAELPTSQIETSTCTVTIPNGFSPNGDGINDYLMITCMDNYPEAVLQIYSRSGSLVYEKRHYGNLDFWGSKSEAWWDGRNSINGSQLNAGSYIYILQLVPGDKSSVKSGIVFISR